MEVAMNPTKSPSDGRVLSCSLPLFHQGDKDKPAVLLIHGFTGSPHDMAYLFEQLSAQGFTVSVPRLPGHGTSAADFKLTGWRDWYRGAMDAYMELRSRYGEVAVGGLSMGGVITAMLAAQFDIKKIVLAAPAFTFTPGSGASWLWLTPLCSWFINSIRRTPEETPEFEGDRKELEREYKSWNWLRQGSELIYLRNRTARMLKRITARSLIIVSRGDNTVSYRTADYLKKRMVSAASVEVMMLQDSNHIVVDDVDREEVAGRISSWLQN